METEKSLINEIEINTVISGLYAGERITKDIYGYHIGDVLLTKDAFAKIEKANLQSPSTSKSNKGLANTKIIFGALTLSLPLYAQSVKDDLNKVVLFARITWHDGQTSELFMQEVIYKELTGKKDVLDIAQNAGARIHDIGKGAIDKLKMSRSTPVTEKEYGSAAFHIPSVIKVVDRAARAGNQLLSGAVGWREQVNNLEVLCIYNNVIKNSGLTFVPSLQNNAIYYEHPHKPGQYLMVDELFETAQMERSAELEQIASKLGAKYFRIEMTDTSEIKSNREEKASTNANAFGVVKAGSNSSYTADAYEKKGHSIIAESHFSEKREPKIPQLSWFENNDKIKSLIEMRLGNGGNALESHSIEIKCSNYSVMNSETAGNLDAVIKKIGIKQNANMKKHVEKERKQIMNFYIEF